MMFPNARVLLLAWVAATSLLHVARAQTLSTRSPFMPEGPAAAGAPTEATPLELRGIVATQAGYLFGLYDPSKKLSMWARVNEPGSDFVIRSHDLNNDSVTVDYQGRVLTLALKTAKVESMGPVPNPALNNLGRGPNQPAVLNPSAADEARRLEGVAAEVRRRRMLRQAAAQQGTPGGPPPGVQPLPGPQPVTQDGVPQPK